MPINRGHPRMTSDDLGGKETRALTPGEFLHIIRENIFTFVVTQFLQSDRVTAEIINEGDSYGNGF